MFKLLLIGFKDLTLAFRDRAALVLMLAAPFALTVGLGFATGRFSGASASGLSDIPVVIVNHDTGDLGGALADLFGAAELAELVEPTLEADLTVAKKRVDDDEAAAVVYVPAGFTDGIIRPDSAAAQIEIYANPTRPTSAGVIQAVVEEFISQVEVGRVSGQVAITQLIAGGLIAPEAAAQAGREIGERQAAASAADTVISIRRTSAGRAAATFDVLAYLAPAMAMIFLMYTVTNGGRSLLAERAAGTLPRLLVTPTTNAQVLGGKLFGIYLTAVAQMAILIIASTLLFGLQWGDPLAVAVLVLAIALGASGWGALLAALAKSPAQVTSVGTAMMLTFALVGGSFISVETLPAYVQILGRVTPNAWGLEGFTALGLGGGLADIAQPLAALAVMGAALFAVAVFMFRRQGVVQR